MSLRMIATIALLVLAGSLAAGGILLGKTLFLPAGLMLFAAILVDPRVAAWIFVLFHFLLYLPVGSDPHTPERTGYSLGAINVYPEDAFLVLFTLLSIGALVLRNAALWRFLRTGLGQLIALFLVYQVVLAGISYADGVGLDRVIRDGALFGIGIIAFYVVAFFDERDFSRLLKFAYVLVLALPIFSLYLYASGQTWTTSTGTSRVYFIGPNVLYLAVIAYHITRTKLRPHDYLLVAYALLGMALTQYRSALVALMVLLLVTAYLWLRRGAISRLVFASLGVVFAVGALAAAIWFVKPDIYESTVERYRETTNLSDKNVQARFGMWEIAWNAFQNRPLVGVGLGTQIHVGAATPQHIERRRWTPHNFMVHLLAVEGAIGLALVLCLHLAGWLRLVNWPKTAAMAYRDVMFVLLPAVFAINTLNTTFTLPRTSFVLWVLLGAIYIYYPGRAPRSGVVPQSTRPATAGTVQPLS